jgi:hypothetical protein
VARRANLRFRHDHVTGETRLAGSLPIEDAAGVEAAIDEIVAKLRVTPGVPPGASLGWLRAKALIQLANQSPQAGGRRADTSIHVDLADLADVEDLLDAARARADDLDHTPDLDDLDVDPSDIFDPDTGPHGPRPHGPAPNGPAPGGADGWDDAEVLAAFHRAHQHELVARAHERIDALRIAGRLASGHHEPWWDPPTPVPRPTGDLFLDGTIPAVLTLDRLERLFCDARTRTVVHDAAGTPIGAGYASREIDLTTFRLLQKRDRGCRVPGCPFRHGLNAHHIVHWPFGPTELINLVLLCIFHHTQVHDGELTITGHPDHQLTFHWTNGTTRTSTL